MLVCTKAQDAEAAIAANAALIDGVPVVVVQNGLDGVDTASRLLPRSSCMGVLSIIAANYTEPGVVRVTTTAASYLGRGDGPADDECRRVAGILSEAVPVIAIGGFRGAQWTKLVVNMLNAVPAIVGRSVQDVVDDRRLRRVVTASMRETVRVGIARGIRFGSLQGLGDRRLRLFARMPLAIGQLLPWLMRVRMGSVPNLGSTQQSVRRGQPTEVDFLNGVVVREASAVGRDRAGERGAHRARARGRGVRRVPAAGARARRGRTLTRSGPGLPLTAVGQQLSKNRRRGCSGSRSSMTADATSRGSRSA